MTQAPAVESSMLPFALGYAARGWRIFPVHNMVSGMKGLVCSCGFRCTSPGKHPRTPNGLTDATTDEATIRGWWKRWPQANIGLATGAASGVVVFDIDTHKGGDSSLAEMLDEHGDIPETVEADTGGGGRHVFLAHPGKRIKNSEGAAGWLGKKGLDFRGDGGYVVATPSNHASGKRYAWADGQDPEHPLAPMPAWMLALHDREAAPRSHQVVPRPNLTPNAELWLGKALAKAHTGQRNATGFWLAAQLRDDGFTENSATPVMRDYAARTERGDEPYTESEAMASLRSAFKEFPRSPAMSLDRLRNGLLRTSGKVETPPPAEHADAPVEPPAPPPGAGKELRALLDGIVSGKIKDVGLPWKTLTRLTQCCLPGSISVLCGDPGVGKTFWSLDCLQYWHEAGIDTAVFFIEKGRVFHTHRLLAQLEGSGNFINYRWIYENGEKVQKAIDRHEAKIDELGKYVASELDTRVTLETLTNWIRQMASAGKRTLIIDPITAADAGRDRWLADDAFITRANKILTAHGCSLLLITHPKQGRKPGVPQANDMSGGGAYNKFVDNVLWLHRPVKPRNVLMVASNGVTMRHRLDLSCQILKARNGTGAGSELAMAFDHTLHFCEYGLVLKEAQDQGQGVDPTDERPPVRAPDALRDPFADDVP